MSTIESFVSADVAPAVAVAGAIEQLLGDDVVLTVGEPRLGADAVADLSPGDDARAVALGLVGRPGACVALVVGPELGESIRVKGEASLIAASGPLLLPAVAALALAGLALTAQESAEEIELAALPADAPIVAFPVLRGSERVAMLVLADSPPGAAIPAESVPAAPHEFQPLGDSPAPSRPTDRALELLNDVEMEVTAELGRKRIPVRELLALTPGAVVELDRAAGSPVDVLVNGTVIARGEVVVIDEEFGIRIVEVLGREDHR